METDEISEQDRKRATVCIACPICARARQKQRGIAYWFVKTIEGRICPNGRAYEKVFGRKTYEPIPVADDGE